MSTISDLRTYRFAQPAHWAKGILDGLETASGSLQPSPIYGPVTREFAAAHGVDRLWYRNGNLTWLTGDGWIEWNDDCEDEPCRFEAPDAVRRAARVIGGRDWLWIIGEDQATISRLDADTFASADPASFANARVCDGAGDGHDGLWVLLNDAAGGATLVHVHGDASTDPPLVLPDAAAGAVSLAYLGNANRFALLNTSTRTLIYLDEQTLSLVGTVEFDKIPPGFIPQRIASDGRDRVAIAGRATAGTPQIAAGEWALLDANGALLASVSSATLSGPASNVAFADIGLQRASVSVATPAGLLVFEPVTSYGDHAPSGRYLTPALYSPPNGVLRGWLRADLLATLPDGATLKVSVLHTADPSIVTQAGSLAAAPAQSPAARIAAIVALLGGDANASMTYPLAGPAALTAPSTGTAALPENSAFPLFRIDDPWIWLLIELHGAPDALPALAELRVRYPNVSLQQYVPTIFRGDATRQQQFIVDPGGTRPIGDPSGFLRNLLGVFETSTQDLDMIVATLGRRIHPLYAQGPWMDFIAQWMDLPWDTVLPDAIKRRILAGAASLLGARGTRSGLKTLLGALLPTARIDIFDSNADVRLARLAGPGVEGATLPAILPGLPADATALSRRAVLGVARLPCAGDPDPTNRFLGILRIDIAASQPERQAVQSILPTIIEAMAPAGLHIVVRWLPLPPDAASGTQDSSVRLIGHGPGQLGNNAVLGTLILAGRRVTRLSTGGILSGFRLH